MEKKARAKRKTSGWWLRKAAAMKSERRDREA
jgi:hypothetical protein